jgi:hypothetical protein
MNKGKTGVFYTKEPEGVAILFRGQQVFRYKSVDEFIETHIKAVQALEEKQESALASEYQAKF